VNENHSFPQDELLDRATRALREASISDGPPPAVVAEVLAALGAVDETVDATGLSSSAAAKTGTGTSPLGLEKMESGVCGSEPVPVLWKPITLQRRIFSMKTTRRITMAAAVCLVVGATLFWLLPRGETLAFADFADTFTAIRTATCRITMEVKFPPDQKLPPGMKLTDGKMVTTGKAMFLAPCRHRMEIEMPDPMTGKKTTAVQVFDMSQGKMLQFMPSQKMATLMHMENMPKNDPRTQQTLFNVREMIANARGGQTGMKVESLGEEVVDGRRIAKFSVGNEAMKMKIWADAKTALPTRMEGTMDMGMSAHMVMDDFRGNEPLDESLFSLAAPEGYKLQELKMDASLPKLADLGNLLRFMAEQKEKTFPDKLPGMKDWQKLIEPVMKVKMKGFKMEDVKHAPNDKKATLPADSKGDKPEEMKPGQMQEMIDAMMPAMRGIQFIGMLTKGNDWHYAGQGVKLNTPDRSIFWYKPADSDKYQVLYADLSVKELAKDALPKLDPSAEKEATK
jgi:outer membrane lipoprotein-sorting protein